MAPVVDTEAVLGVEVVFFAVLFDDEFGDFGGDGDSYAFPHFHDVLECEFAFLGGEVLEDTTDSLIG